VSYLADYFRRQIEILAAAVARAIGKGGHGPDRQAAEELDHAIAAGTGLHASLLLRLDPTSVLTLVGTERAHLVADALEARAWVVEPDEMAKSFAAAKRLRARLARDEAQALNA
jgi:hypothetical protein